MTNTLRRLALACFPTLLIMTSGCFGVRTASDWTGVTDERLPRVCKVTPWGSGVIISAAGTDVYILTCSHVIQRNTSVSVWVINKDRRWLKLKADVVASTDPAKEDLALLKAALPMGSNIAFGPLAFADAFSEGEERESELLAVAGIPSRKPVIFKAKVFQYTVNKKAQEGAIKVELSWGNNKAPEMPKGCFHGGINQANSGTPIFEDTKLVGLVESSPFLGVRTIDQNSAEITSGICTSLPQTLKAFMELANTELNRKNDKE